MISVPENRTYAIIVWEMGCADSVYERSRKLDEKLRKFRLYQNIRDAIGG